MNNALRYTKVLEKVNFTREQAEKIVTIMADSMNDNFASKYDLKDSFNLLDTKIDKVYVELDQKIDRVYTELKNDIKKLESDLTIKMGAMMVIAVATLYYLLKV